jgi:putative DNA-invertase from lambdoid prophage Rac
LRIPGCRATRTPILKTASKVLALVAQGRSYRLVGRELGLRKITVAGIVQRSRSATSVQHAR